MLLALLGMVYLVAILPDGYRISFVSCLLKSTPFNEEKLVLLLSTLIAVKDEQPSNVSSAMLVTLLGIVIDVNDVHPPKDSVPKY